MSKAIEVDTKTFIRFWLVVAVLVLLVNLVDQAKMGLLIVGISIFLALAFRPLVLKIDKHLGKKNHLGLAAGITVTGVVLFLSLIIATVGPVVVSETSKFLAQAPDQIQDFIDHSDFIADVGERFGISDVKGQLNELTRNTFKNMFGSFPQTLFSSVGAIASFLMGAILTLVLTILFITQGPGVLKSLLSRLSTKSQKASRLANRIMEKISDVISGYVTGQLFVAVIDAIFTGFTVFVLSLIFGFSSGLALPMAMISLVFYMIPMFGQIMTDVIVSFTLFVSSPWAGLIYLVIYLVFAQVEANIIAPRIQGNKMSLPPLLILVAITIGIYAFGLIGAIISIPIAGIIKVLLDEYQDMRALSAENS